MKRKTVDELKGVAEIHGPQMTKQQRLVRWADLLDRQANRILTSLMEVEYAPPRERAEMRVGNSALSVAFEDPVLRAEGLKSDKLLAEAFCLLGLREFSLDAILFMTLLQ